MENSKLKKLYETACNEYVKSFCKKHGYEYDPDAWVGDEVGGIICVSDYYINMETIRYDIDLNAPKNEFSKWYDYILRAGDLGYSTPNFKSWIKGCPLIDKEILDKADELKEKIRAFENELQQLKIENGRT